METSLANRMQHSNLSNSLGSSGFKISHKLEYDEVITEIKDSNIEDFVKPGLSKSESDQFRDQLIQELNDMEEGKINKTEDQTPTEKYSQDINREEVQDICHQSGSGSKETRLKPEPKQIKENGIVLFILYLITC